MPKISEENEAQVEVAKIKFMCKQCRIAQGVLPEMSRDLQGQCQGHPRSNIDIIRKMFKIAWGV